MKLKLLLLIILINNVVSVLAQDARPDKAALTTRWTKEVNPLNTWQQYPRPQMERAEWKNLNGLWDYAILPQDAGKPVKYDGKILVPFPVESLLSGVRKKVNPGQKLWYHTTFEIPVNWNSKDIILHIGACDWESEIRVNGQTAVKHRGGYDHIDTDITSFLKKGLNELVITVTDPTDTGWQPLGKQVLKPGGIFYTSTTGIWQTVWLEPVSHMHIQSFKFYPDIDKKELRIHPDILNATTNTTLKATAFHAGKKVAEITAKAGADLVLDIPDAVYWTPGHPELYDLDLVLAENNTPVDQIKSYFGMRKIAIGKWKDGFTRILLNNEFVFQNGPLDQGFWPDGIYTQPTEDALKYDLTMVRKLGFNMLRKHVKVEPDRFYYWCDKMGILVWQDMPNGDRKIDVPDPDIQRTPESETQYHLELKNIIDQHFNFPSIVMWVPFNEGWGQFNTAEVVDRIKKQDPTRLVNNASGWADRGAGDVLDVHTYPAPVCPQAEANRAIVIGEFGGLGLKTPGHMWEKTNWGYQTFSTNEDLTDMYSRFYQTITDDVVQKGLSAVVYTQLTDVETEANGLMTYDREIVKINPNDAFLINTLQAIPKPEIFPVGEMVRKGDQVQIRSEKGAQVRFTTDGTEPAASSEVYLKPIAIERNVILKATAFANGKPGRTATRSFHVTDLQRPVYLHPYSSQYTAGGDFALRDGILGTELYNDGAWQGFEEADLDVTFDLQKITQLHHITVRFIENQDSWVFLPSEIAISVSSDGKNFTDIDQVTINTVPETRKDPIKTITTTVNNKKVRFVKVFGKNIGKCPDWHKGKGGKAWLFVDEIKMD